MLYIISGLWTIFCTTTAKSWSVAVLKALIALGLSPSRMPSPSSTILNHSAAATTNNTNTITTATTTTSTRVGRTQQAKKKNNPNKVANRSANNNARLHSPYPSPWVYIYKRN